MSVCIFLHRFKGKAIRKEKCGEFESVIAEVAGNAYYTGKSLFTFEEDDPFKNGFLVK